MAPPIEIPFSNVKPMAKKYIVITLFYLTHFFYKRGNFEIYFLSTFAYPTTSDDNTIC